MKNKLRIIALFMLCTLLLVACGVPGGGEACQHRDADDDNFCDLCQEAYADGVDVPVCEHSDGNDDALCDICGEPYEDGEDIPDAPVCQHRDADDNALCDKCGEAYEDEKDLPDSPEEHHVDADLDHACDCGCGTRFGTHWDTDKNHVCDYGCSESLGVHDDLDKDHACDYCAGNIGECLDANKNHACDYGCAKTFGMHLDENFDHVCDYGCELLFGAHLDENKDHTCDYGCSVAIGAHNANGLNGTCDYCGDVFVHDCVDTDKTHLCDVCGALLSECEDLTPVDHLCDLCGETLSACADDNRDHTCDIGCGKQFGTHADTDKNGTCDYCEATIDHDCVDGDRDHWCDYGCEDAYFGECTDNDRDSKCDYGCDRHYCWDQDEDSYCDFGCGAHFCYDENRDHVCDFDCGKYLGEHRFNGVTHFCDYCGERMTECYDFDPLDHNCDLCGERFSECYDDSDHLCDVCGERLSDCFDDDYDHDCDVCSAIISECINEIFDHKCDICGQILILDCIDDDCDHYCDYAGCGERVSSCEDLYPHDHKCDLCSEILSVCEDTDFDHKCDLLCDNYDKFYETHVDENKDHICDAYGEQCQQGLIGTCEDANNDGYCDHGCGKQFEIEADAPLYTREGDYIYFGEYPQTIKADDVTITETLDSRGYFLGSDGCYYAKVTATPNNSNYTFSTGATVVSETVYYFKVEPIRWRILEEKNGTALILCDSIIANMVYDEGNSNDYKDSDVRVWLNAQFYKMAFGVLQKQIISSYACENTEDKVFLLSYEEVTNRAYGFASNYGTSDTARRMITSDYARATGAYTNMSTSSSYYGNGFWWLRTSYDSHSSYARVVYNDGYAGVLDYVFFSNRGVVPALQILLVGDCVDEDKNHSCDICGAVIGFHVDENKDHECDAYGADCALFADTPAHLDENIKDHLCDAYGTECALGELGDHADTDFNHACDYGCLIAFGTCEDADGNGYCDYGCGKQFEIEADAPLYTREGDYIYFGEYPQTIKADDVTITETQDNRGYFLGSDGCYYAKIIATPFNRSYTFSTGATVVSETVYYFKVEPIRWRILTEENGAALILCDSIIANVAYDAGTGYNNNYKDSDVRAWLNAQFYETAFGELEQKIILMTIVDNSAESTGNNSNTFACEDTEDKIFLLSYEEVSGVYGIITSDSRRLLTSDYARAMGAHMSTSNGSYGCGYWFLRSPYVYSSIGVRFVPFDGNMNKYVSVNLSCHGVVPALWICL